MTSLFDEPGWYKRARRVDSPNCDARPAEMPIDLLVIHNISLPPNDFSSPLAQDAIERFFTNTLDYAAHPYFETLRGVHVSAHFLIRRDGCLIQFVAGDARAWHAGVSCYSGRERCNDFSIGIELEGGDTLPFEEAQYQSLGALTEALLTRYPIGAVVGHSLIAPGRKTDPGPHFDWPRYRKRVPAHIDMPELDL